MKTLSPFFLSTCTVLLMTTYSIVGLAQSPSYPSSDIYLFSIDWKESQMKFSKPVWLSHFNEGGYNNQPRFINDNEFLFTSNVENQMDIFLGNLLTRKLKNITQTDQFSEYSPSYASREGKLRVVLVDPDNRQFLAEYNGLVPGNSKVIVEGIENVGYYFYHTSDSLILFRVDQPNQLWLYTLSNKGSRALSRNIGRCFGAYGKGAFLYTIKEGGRSVLRSMSPSTGQSQFIAFMPEGVEDFIVLHDRTVICAHKNKLMQLELGKVIGGNWVEIFNFEPWGLDNVSRLAINPAQTLLIITNTK
jgi:Tol biopolymer transport system component